MKLLYIDPILYEAAPDYQDVLMVCTVCNTTFDEAFWKEMEAGILDFSHHHEVEDINKRPAIRAMRQLYKKLGKDPNRYRPSSEALCRRILKEKSLYRINTLVDIINLVSIHSGFSIGGFDFDKVVGNLRLGVGTSGEVFDAIGRGPLNIEGLPVYRDEVGGIGTPTSDEERTKIDLQTRKLLFILHSAEGIAGMEEALALATELLKKYVHAKDFEVQWVG